VSAILKGTHPDQLVENQRIAFPVLYKPGSPLLGLKAARARPVMQ